MEPTGEALPEQVSLSRIPQLAHSGPWIRQPPRSAVWDVAIAVTACLVPLIAAMSLGFTSPALDTMKGVKDGKDVAVPNGLAVFVGQEDMAAWFSSLINVGALAGALGGAFAVQVAGLRGSMQLTALLLGGGWLAIAVSRTPAVLCGFRVVIGLGCGLQSVAVPMFIAEVSPPNLRGTLGTLNAAFILLGVVVVDAVGGLIFTDSRGFCMWNTLSMFIAVCAAILFGLLMVLPEPRRPTWCGRLLSLVKPETAQSTPNQSPEHLSSRASVDFESSPTAQAAFSAASDVEPWKLAVAGLVPMCWQQLSGMNFVIFFDQSILSTAGVGAVNILGPSVFAVQLLGIGVAAALIERLGRRPLLLISTGGMAVAGGALGLLLRLPKPSSVLVIAGLYSYVVFFAIGLGPVPWLLLPELGLAKRQRARLASIATAANWGCSFIVTGPPLQTLVDQWGLSGAFFLFGVVCLLGFVLMALVVPETASRRRHGLERRFTIDMGRTRRPGLFRR